MQEHLYVKNFKCHLTTAGNQNMSLKSVQLVKDCTSPMCLACQLARPNNEELYTTKIRIRITQKDDGLKTAVFSKNIAKPKSACPRLKTYIKNNKFLKPS